MNRPDKAGEPSMEEILASIRQIIADEPSTDRPASVADVTAAAGQSSSPDRSPAVPSVTGDGRAPPLLDRLSGVLKSGSLPPTKPLGSKRPLSFDQDLADMFDEDDASAVAAPKPDIRVPPELSAPAQPKPAETSAVSTAKPELNGASALPPQLAPSKAFVPPLPFGASDPPEKEIVAPPAPRSFGFPPLRKQGFIPQTTPVLPPLPPAEAKAVEPALGASALTGRETAEDALKRLSGLGAVVPGEIATPSSQPSTGLFGAPSALGAGDGGAGSAGLRTPELSLNADRAPSSEPVSSPSPAPKLATPAPLRAGFIDSIADHHPLSQITPAVADVKPADEPKLPPLSPASAISDKIFEERPLPSFSAVNTPAAATPPPASVSPPAEPPRYTAGADTAAVAAQALDALAQGLAASAAASAVSSAAAGSAIPLTPIIDPPAPVAHPVPFAPANALQPAAPTGAAPPRTLEDAVADMLRPMLQQWVADNMPRIIEKALRVEMAKSMKPGSKPPGT